MLKCVILSIKEKICNIIRGCLDMIAIKKSRDCILIQKKYDKHERELPVSVPSCGILGIKISQTKIVSGRVNSRNENNK